VISFKSSRPNSWGRPVYPLPVRDPYRFHHSCRRSAFSNRLESTYSSASRPACRSSSRDWAVK
jgi:hypothetical protein